jgi:FMN phosphatase YigB (HAD superfamily)
MNKPEVVVFDLGKVLVDFDYTRAARRIAAQGTLPGEQVQEIIDHSPLLVRFETGAINRHQFFAEVCRVTGFRGTLEEFARFFADIFTPIEPMVQLHARLRQRHVPTFIFSNTNDLAVGHIRSSFPFFSQFEGYVLSYEHGFMKPHVGLYEVLERVTGRKGPQILYLDDRLENVQAGAARGWQVIHHQSAEITWPIFEKLNLIE